MTSDNDDYRLALAAEARKKFQSLRTVVGEEASLMIAAALWVAYLLCMVKYYEGRFTITPVVDILSGWAPAGKQAAVCLVIGFWLGTHMEWPIKRYYDYCGKYEEMSTELLERNIKKINRALFFETVSLLATLCGCILFFLLWHVVFAKNWLS